MNIYDPIAKALNIAPINIDVNIGVDDHEPLPFSVGGFVGLKHSEEMKQRMRGRKLSEETKMRMRLAKLGKKGNFAGKKHSDETKKRIGLSGKGRKHTEETKLRISNTLKKSLAKEIV